MKRWRWLLVIPGLLAAAAVLALFGFAPHRLGSGATASSTVQISIDADPTNGRPCDPIDTLRAVDPGQTYTVGVCVENQPQAPYAFQLRVIYDGDLNTAPEVADVSPALDDNPDANDGDGAPAGDKLGTKWDCTGFGIFFPTGDDPYTPESDAFIICNANIGSPDADLTISPGLLATITFQASTTNLGVENLTFGTDSEVTGQVATMGSCGDVEPVVPCNGATIFKGITPTPAPTLTPTVTPSPTITPTPTFTPTPTQTPLYSPTPTFTPVPPEEDMDGDGIANLDDNCPTVFNPDQTNTPLGPIDSGPGAPGDDITVPNEDNLGDVCDNDTDNDGLSDLEELAGCGFGPTDPGIPILDDTYDDDGDGNPVPPMGTDTDGSDDGPSWDTDGDGVLDGAECDLGYDPTDPTSKPTSTECGGTGDSDGDGLLDSWEVCGWGTNPNLIESDGDGLSDCWEAADVDGNGWVTYTGDVMIVSRAALVPSPPTKSGVMDMDKNGVITFEDSIFVAKVRLKAGFCPAPPPPIPGDLDVDGVLDAGDNCPRVFNPDQTNTPMGCIDNGPGLAGDDCTVPNEDNLGDACDPDTDNDGLTDRLEALPDASGNYACAILGGPNVPTDPGFPVLDNTFDDDGDGDPVPPLGNDIFDDGPSWDTDGDGVPDGAECSRGYDPADRTTRPTTAECGGAGDADGDGLRDAWELCGWGTNPNSVHTDTDGLGDCVEAADVDGNGTVKYTTDTIAVTKAAILLPSSFGKAGDFDIDKNGAVKFTSDVIQSAKFSLALEVCQ